MGVVDAAVEIAGIICITVFCCVVVHEVYR